MGKSILLLQMLELMREEPGLTIGQMAIRLGRSERTIYRYLESLSDDLHLPIYCEDGGYHIAERAVASRLGLSPKEVLATRLALTSTAIRRSGPFGEYAVSAWGKVEAALTADSIESLESAVRRYSIYTPSFSDSEIKPGILKCLADAVENNKRLSVDYNSRQSGDRKNLTLDPYALVFRRHNWYLIAFSHSHRRVIQLKLLRIIDAAQTGESFQLPNDFSVDSFYAKSWEMWTGSEEQTVLVKFSPRVAPIVRESKRHPTQQIMDTPDGGVIFSATVAGIEEIGFWILSWGADAEVLEPAELRDSIATTATNMAAKYSAPVSVSADYPMAAESMSDYTAK